MEEDDGWGEEENSRRRKPLHMADVRTAGGGIPGGPGNGQIGDVRSSGDWETRGSGVRAKFRFTATDPFFYRQVQKQWGPKVLRFSKATGLAQIIGGLPPIIWANREFGKSIVSFGVRRFAVYEKKPQVGLMGDPRCEPACTYTVYTARMPMAHMFQRLFDFSLSRQVFLRV